MTTLLLSLALLLGFGYSQRDIIQGVVHYAKTPRRTVNEVKEETLTVYNNTNDTLNVEIKVNLHEVLIKGAKQFGWLQVKDLAPGESRVVKLIDALSQEPNSLASRLDRLESWIRLDIYPIGYRLNDGPEEKISFGRIISFGPGGSVSFGPQ